MSWWPTSAAPDTASCPHGLPASRSRVSELSPPSAFGRQTCVAQHQNPKTLSRPRQPYRIMCGIFFSLSRAGYVTPDPKTKRLLQNRGPDATGQYQTLITLGPARTEDASTRTHATFLSTVLALRGKNIVEQPLRDETTGSVLCWNGEAWTISGNIVNGNDSQLTFTKLLEACADKSETSTRHVVDLLSSVRGPYAFVFYDALNKRVYYGRDCLGRRSLLRKEAADGAIVLSSVCDNASGQAWAEVDADGIHVVDLMHHDTSTPFFSTTRIPHRLSDQAEGAEVSFVGKSFRPWDLLTALGSTLPSYEL